MNRRGFTLIELLITVSIMVLLSGMAMPLLSMTKRQAMRTRTQTVLHQVDSALRQFKQEYGVYPYQQRYPDLASGDTFDSVPNRLGYALGTDISARDSTLVRADMDAAMASYAYAINPSNQQEEAQPSLVTFTSADSAGTVAGNTWGPPVAVALNRMAQERAREAVLAGDLQLVGATILTPAGGVVRDASTTRVLTAPSSTANPGWAADYLHGQIDPHYLRNGSILDAWGHALVYINQTVPAIHGTTIWSMGYNIDPFDTRYFGLGAQGFDPTSSVAASLKGMGRGYLLGCGRMRLSPADAGDGLPPPAEPTALPDPTQLWHSDVRYTAAPGFEAEFELWSAGPDGQFAWYRDDPTNTDNIAIQPYRGTF